MPSICEEENYFLIVRANWWFCPTHDGAGIIVKHVIRILAFSQRNLLLVCHCWNIRQQTDVITQWKYFMAFFIQQLQPI